MTALKLPKCDDANWLAIAFQGRTNALADSFHGMYDNKVKQRRNNRNLN